MPNFAWRHFMVCLLDNRFTNKKDCFTDYDGDSKIMFESIFMMVLLLIVNYNIPVNS